MAVPADQRWFWTPEWQTMEREADLDLAAGRSTHFATGEGFLEHLAQIGAGGPAG
ncbi:MAG: hypothetical protein ACR2KG_07555 [Nocardioidaceae bacterium]